MAHIVTIDGKKTEVATAHETYLADGVNVADIPTRNLLALVAMGKIDKKDSEVKARIEEAGKEALEMAEKAPDCLTCSQKAALRKQGLEAKRAATKAETEAKAAPTAESATETTKATPKKRGRKPAAKTTAKATPKSTK